MDLNNCRRVCRPTLFASNCNGAEFCYKVTAADNCPAMGNITCVYANGTAAPVNDILGYIARLCRWHHIHYVHSHGRGGLTTSGTFTVTVIDTPPTITCPADICEECSGNGAPSAVYTVSASDTEQGDLSSQVTCSTSSGSSFPLGTTTVTCSVTDCNGGSASCSFTVKVQDTTPPVIQCPAPGSSSCPVAQTFSATSTDVCYSSSSLTLTCTPSTYPANDFDGVTHGSCSAKDASGNLATCSFSYAVVDISPPS